MNNEYLELLDNTTDWFWEVDILGKYIYSNKIVEEYLGYSVQEILEMTPFDLMDEETKKELSILFNETLIKQTKIYNLNYTAIKKDGTSLYLELNALPIYDKNNNLKGFRGISRNITKRVKEDIKKRYEFLSKILDYIPIPVFYKDNNGLYLGVNKSWEVLTGLKKEDIINKTVYDIAPKEIADIYYEQDKKVFNLEENPQIYESEVYNKTNEKRYKVIFNKSSFFDEKGNVSGLIGTIIDKSEITKLEEEKIQSERILIQQSKLSAMGEMLENIAHQWRQPLSAITSSATGSKIQKQMDCLPDNQLYSVFDTINDHAQYLSQTIDTFRGFLNPKSHELMEVQISQVVDKTLELVNSQFIRKKIKIIKNIENIQISIYENELIQIIINLINNSRDELDKLENTEKYIFIDIFTKNNNLILEIKDNAGGVPINIIDRIFEPYFTTKHKSLGTGIGLYMSEKIVKRYLEGTIQVKNEIYKYQEKEYKGAKFTTIIPL